MKEMENKISYVSGLFDGGGNIYFRISKSNRDLGYRINPTVIIHINQNAELYGFLDEFFFEHNIQFKIKSSSNRVERIEIDTRGNVERFLKLIEEKTIQHSSSTKFILEELYPIRDCGDILKKENFLKMVETIEMLQPRRVSNSTVKYDSNFFYEKWDINNKLSPVMIPTTDIEDEFDPEYMAGFFDGAGKIRPVIHKSSTTETGYTVSLRVGVTRSWLRDSTVNKMTEALESIGVNYNINKQNSRVSIHVTEYDSIEKFLDSIDHNLIANFEICMLTLDKILPSLKDNYHKTKQGIHDIVALYEMVMKNSASRKYTSKYFRDQWNEVDPL
jgi:hypothetical protein